MQKTIVSMAMLGFGLSLAAQQTITCTSNGTRRQLCPADTSNGVVLVRERSDHVCQQGSTWSYSRQGISVSGGCSADFQVAGNASTSDRNYGSGAYDNNANGNNTNGTYANGNGSAAGNGYGNNGNANGVYGNRGNRRAVLLPSGTQLSVRLEQAIRPTEVNQGEFVSMTLVNDLSVNGTVIAPVGTPVQGKVASQHGSTLDLRLSSMTVNGQTYPLVSNSVHSLRDSQSQGDTTQSGKAQLGSLLGTIASGGQIPSGSVFNFRLTDSSQPGAVNQ